MKLYIEIEGDTNDADYITQRTEIEEEDLNLIEHIIQKIDKCQDNWPAHDYCKNGIKDKYRGILTDDEIDLMRELVPYGEYGIHTITSITLLKVAEETKLM